MKKLIVTLSLAALLGSCSHKSTTYNQTNASNNMVTITRATSDYNKIRTSGSLNVKLVEGKEGTITITGEETRLEMLKTEVVNGTLSVYIDNKNSNNYNYNSIVEITIPVEKIDELEFSGSGSLSSSTVLNSEKFQVNMSGSGEVKLSVNATTVKISKSGSGFLRFDGKTTNLEADSSGSGSANLYDLSSENVAVSQSGSGNIKVNCTKNLSATCSGSGSIQYKGNPEKLNKSSSGSGSISGS